MYKVKIENNLKSLNKKLQNSKKISLGAWMQISSPSIAGIMASKDFDWVTIDMEHGEFHEINLSSIFNAIENFNKLPFVRVSNKETDKIPNFLDLGAKGILIPKIETKKELIKIISETYFPPHGNRGVSFCRANSYGKYFNEYYKSSINNLIIPMIETKKSLENLDEILSLRPIKSIFIGPYDLKNSLGIKSFDKNFKKIILSIVKAAKKHKKTCGIHCVENSDRELKKFIKEGFNPIAYSTDAIILNNIFK